MAFVGAFHRPELERFLSAQGGSISSPHSVRLPPSRQRKVPEPVVQLWRDGVERMKAQAAVVSGKLSDSLKTKAAYFKVAADHGGDSCIDPSAFKAASTN